LVRAGDHQSQALRMQIGHMVYWLSHDRAVLRHTAQTTELRAHNQVGFRTGPARSTALESGEVLETPFSALVCIMIHEDAEQRFHTGQLLKLFEKKSTMLDARRTKIKEMTTSASRMVGTDTLYASSCLRPLLRDHMVLLRLLGSER
jgi:hypothetical protein